MPLVCVAGMIPLTLGALRGTGERRKEGGRCQLFCIQRSQLSADVHGSLEPIPPPRYLLFTVTQSWASLHPLTLPRKPRPCCLEELSLLFQKLAGIEIEQRNCSLSQNCLVFDIFLLNNMQVAPVYDATELNAVSFPLLPNPPIMAHQGYQILSLDP